MPDLVTMKALTTFHNARVVNDKGGLVEDGDTFRTDSAHAKDLARLKHAEPVSGSIDDIPDTALQPHHTVSASALAADRKRRGVEDRQAAAGELDAIRKAIAEARARAEGEIASHDRRVAESKAKADTEVAGHESRALDAKAKADAAVAEAEKRAAAAKAAKGDA